MSYKIRFTNVAIEDIRKLRKSGDKVVLKKIDDFIDELKEHPFTGTGKPKPLSSDRLGQWSRRITSKHRLVYSVEEEIITVFIISISGHYGDK